jgi:hypothetical protein
VRRRPTASRKPKKRLANPTHLERSGAPKAARRRNTSKQTDLARLSRELAAIIEADKLVQKYRANPEPPNDFCRARKPHSSVRLSNPTRRTGRLGLAWSDLGHRNAREPPSMSKGATQD